MRHIRNEAYIDGQWVKADKSFAVTDPSNLEIIQMVSDCGEGETRMAIDAAHAAFPLWSGRPAAERADILLKWKNLIAAQRNELAELLTKEQGKPLKESLAEIGHAEPVEWAAEEAKRTYGYTIPAVKNGTEIMTYKQPVGVVAAITPWNFPHSMITRKVAPALAAGCTVVLKPAQDTPLSALALAALAEEAGFPKGVLNIIPASKENTEAVGMMLSTDPKISKISFTGSTPVGRKLMAQASATVKKVSLELGGNAPFIVFDSADVIAAAKGAVSCKFRNAGQTCICANRIFVQAGIYDVFLKAFREEIKKLRVGSGLEEGVTVGPLINKAGLEKVERLVADATDKGARIELGGVKAEEGELFYAPTLISGADRGMAMFEEEIFGPVAPLYQFDTEEEAVQMANDTIYGLAAYFYTQDLAQALRVSAALQYGMVGVNEIALSGASIPFGGIKQSGLGREGGPHALDDVMETKYILFGKSGPS